MRLSLRFFVNTDPGYEFLSTATLYASSPWYEQVLRKPTFLWKSECVYTGLNLSHQSYKATSYPLGIVSVPILATCSRTYSLVSAEVVEVPTEPKTVTGCTEGMLLGQLDPRITWVLL